MELNVIIKKHGGKNNRAFDSEQVNIDMEGDDDFAEERRATDPHNKSSLERRAETLCGCLEKHRQQLHLVVWFVVFAGFVTMVTAACVLNLQRALGLLVLFLVTMLFLLWDWLVERYGDQVWGRMSPVRELLSRKWLWIRWAALTLAAVTVVSWLVLDTAQQGTRQLVSFFGLMLFIFLMLLFSKHPYRWSLQTLLCGAGLQFLFALLIFRTKYGLSSLQWLGKQAEIFMSFADVGSKFVFGDSYTNHYFIFRVMPILVFLSSVTSVLYHVGFMPWLICKIGSIMQVTMGTSPTESMVAAGNIFLGHTDAPLLIRPYIRTLTVSEIHAVMTGGFASVSGTILGAFVSIGVDGSHLLTAALLSAPASLAVAKTIWPETETSPALSHRDLRVKAKGESESVLEAASQGARRAVGLVATVVANLIAFLALLGFVDAVLSWLGAMLNCPQLSFSFICSYVFMPLSFMMGVSWEDSFTVAELIGIKTFLNEFVAYQKMAELSKKRNSGAPEYENNVKQYISVHSETIATYALCGFSNIAALGMSIGVLSTMAPERRADISRCGFRALIGGSVSCFMTACIAGMLYIPDPHCSHVLTAESMINTSQLLGCCKQLFNSVATQEEWNTTIGDRFDNLLGCCTRTPNVQFNCSALLRLAEGGEG